MLLVSFDYIVILLRKISTPLSGFGFTLCRKKRQLKCCIVCTDKHVQLQHRQHNPRGQFFMAHSVEVSMYSVSGRKVNHCIHFRNFGKQRRILTKFCINNTTSSHKQIAKFQYNLSMYAKVTASLASSPENIYCPLLTVFRYVTVKCLCSKYHLCAQMQAWRLILSDWFMYDQLTTWLDRSNATSAGRRHQSGCSTHAPTASSDPVVYIPGWGKDCWLARELEYEVWCFVG